LGFGRSEEQALLHRPGRHLHIMYRDCFQPIDSHQWL
jgi:hypothetical protein